MAKYPALDLLERVLQAYEHRSACEERAHCHQCVLAAEAVHEAELFVRDAAARSELRAVVAPVLKAVAGMALRMEGKEV